nr:uncharacterized protein LOC129282974 [Lytechinus pictus]
MIDDRVVEASKTRQQNKFARLLEKKNAENSRNFNTNIASDCIGKWVKNCSDRLLRDSELSVLVKGLNFSVAPTEVPVVDIITSTETACRKLNERSATELRSKVVGLLSRPRKLEPNLNKEETEALNDLKKDKNIRVLPADKGRTVVILNTCDYNSKCESLLNDTNTYKKLGSKDPTSKYKKELVSALQEIERDGGINRDEYRRLYPTTDTPPKFYGLPKIHKPNIPLRPIVSSIGSITYNCAKHLAYILSPLVGQTCHHVTDSQSFAECIKNARVEEDEELRSYDVTALFTSVPIDKALKIIQSKLQSVNTWKDRTRLSVDHIVKLLDVCLRCTYFVHNGIYYQQIHGAAMGSPISPIVCNLYMEHFEQLALESAPHPPIWWFRYVDDTHTKLKKEFSQEFTDHLNLIDPDIQFTTEGEEGRSLAFLDTLTVIQPDGNLDIKVYRKPTHTDQYLNFSSNHPLEHKLGVIKTLFHRAEAVITDPVTVSEEKAHVKRALSKCGYPSWVFNKIDNSAKGKSPPRKDNPKPPKGQIVLPYVKGLSEALRRNFSQFGIRVCYKPTRTLRQYLVAPKDKTEKKDITGPIYLIPCQGQTTKGLCQESYIGETERSLRTRFLEHRRPSSTSSEVSQHIHIESPGHCVDINKVQVLDREPRYFERGVKEAIYIRAFRPSLNRDGGRYKLPNVYDPIIDHYVTKVKSGHIADEGCS